jgi:hypothetical protein
MSDPLKGKPARQLQEVSYLANARSSLHVLSGCKVPAVCLITDPVKPQNRDAENRRSECSRPQNVLLASSPTEDPRLPVDGGTVLLLQTAAKKVLHGHLGRPFAAWGRRARSSSRCAGRCSPGYIENVQETVLARHKQLPLQSEARV